MSYFYKYIDHIVYNIITYINKVNITKSNVVNTETYCKICEKIHLSTSEECLEYNFVIYKFIKEIIFTTFFLGCYYGTLIIGIIFTIIILLNKG